MYGWQWLFHHIIEPDDITRRWVPSIICIWLVAEPTPLTNMSKSVGMMKFSTEWEKETSCSKQPIR